MSEIEGLCRTCKNNCKNCENIQVIYKGKCKIIKCLNYETDKNKLHHYTDFRYKIKSK